ncbi:MbtH family protein [Paenibacillus solani]|uniref:MbtH family protein n=1 Tax=Paenibacillus solani TaxID=1705565 RepID=UPI003D2E3F61
MTNPFEHADGKFLVLMNHEGQYSLWPAFAAIPAGWHQVLGLSTREECFAYINENWVDLRPRSLCDNTRLLPEHRP